MLERITAAMLYDFVRCPHRVTMDLFGNYAYRDPVSPFVQLLWDRGHAFEQEVIDGLEVPFTNLVSLAGEEKEAGTREAMERGDELIYRGRITFDDLLGEPDLLRRQAGGYQAGDIKSGAGLEGASDDTDGKPKKHYAVQLALYTDVLQRLGKSDSRTAFVWDVHGDEVPYDLTAAQGARNPDSLWDLYTQILEQVRSITSDQDHTQPALASDCKLCHWRSVCSKQLKDSDDLSLIPQLGRAKRDAMVGSLRTVRELATADLGAFSAGKKTVFPGIGVDSLKKFQARAKLLTDPAAKPYVKQAINLPVSETELFFDIETDPMRDICYLHGFVERRGGDNDTEQYHYFLAQSPSPEEEERVFAEALDYVRSRRPCIIYYYSKYERTWWRSLQKRYPSLASEAEIESIFDPSVAIDLYYDVVSPHTEWPTNDYSIKTLAKYLGFEWRDKEPSGAASIEWYHRWVESGDSDIRKRILDYNEDDCVATRWLLDGIRKLVSG